MRDRVGVLWSREVSTKVAVVGFDVFAPVGVSHEGMEIFYSLYTLFDDLGGFVIDVCWLFL